jgi:hypothetical protein
MAAPPVQPSTAEPTRRHLRRSAIAVAAAALIAGAVAGYAFGLNGGHNANAADRKTGIGAAATTRDNKPVSKPEPEFGPGLLPHRHLGRCVRDLHQQSDRYVDRYLARHGPDPDLRAARCQHHDMAPLRAAHPTGGRGHVESCLERYSDGGLHDPQRHDLRESNVQSHGSWVVDRDGAFNNSGTLQEEQGPYPYTCTATKLTIYYGPQSYSEVLGRATPKSTRSTGVSATAKHSSTPIGS